MKCLQPENRTLDLCTKQNSVFAELINILRIRFHIQGHDALFQKLLRAPIKKFKFWPRGLCIANNEDNIISTGLPVATHNRHN